MQSWASQELSTVALGDPRRARRLVQLVEALSSQPSVSVPRACGTWASTKAAYRFWDNDHVSSDMIRSAHTEAAIGRIEREDLILIAQDTTELNFKHQAKGLGRLRKWTKGMLAHTALAISCEGVPLGVIAQQIWTRTDNPKKHRRKRATSEKESQRWLTTELNTLAVLPENVQVVTIADREADIYALFAQPRRVGADLLIRATHNRRVAHPATYLWQALEQAPVMDKKVLKVGRTPSREPRSAKLTLRFLEIALHAPHRSSSEAVVVRAILVEEVEAPPEAKPLKWLLLSTLEVNDVATAWQLVRWYCMRWLVERYHYVLKSGCRIESLQLGSAAQLERALATYSIVAWRLLWLTYEARRHPNKPCHTVLETDQWQALTTNHYGDPLAITVTPTLAEAILWIAQLGGFMARKNDGPPGVKVLWQGMQRLNDITQTWRMIHNNRALAQKDVGNA